MNLGYYDSYVYDKTIESANDMITLFAVLFAVIVGLVLVAILVFTIIGMWKVFEKNKLPGWYALIPGFNVWKYLELSDIPGWTMFLPYANVLFIAIASYKIAIKMGKDMVFGIINVFYPFIGLMILGFSNTKEVEIKKTRS